MEYLCAFKVRSETSKVFKENTLFDSQSILKNIFICVCVYVPISLSVCVLCIFSCLGRQEVGFGAIGAEVIGDCQLSDNGCWELIHRSSERTASVLTAEPFFQLLPFLRF